MTNTFDPVLYNAAEAAWLKANMDVPPAQALRDLPPGVNPNAVRPVLLRIQELKQLGEAWCGVQALKDALDVWAVQATKWRTDKRRGAPRFPSMHSYDSRGRAFDGGPGADQGQVRTYFEAGGARKPFAVQLVGEAGTQWTPDWVTTEHTSGGLVVNADANRIECTVCGHAENYRAESRSAYNAARGRMSKHLRNAKDEVERHREAHLHEFGQAAKAGK